MGIKLGNICRFQSGGTPSKGKPEFFNGTIPWITTTALNGGNIGKESAVDWISEQAIKESAAKIVPAFSIMVGTRVGVGKVAINTMSMSTSQDIISLLDIDESIWSKAFLCKFLQAKGAFLNAQARGATIKGIKIDVLSELELPDIPIEEQQHISQIIDKVKTTIAIRQSQLQKLDELVKARFVELFGDMILNPNSWEKVDLGTVCDVRDGTHDSPKYFAEGIPLVTSRNLSSGRIDFTDCNLICEADYNKINERSKVDLGDILMPMIGTVGNPIIVDIDAEFAIKNVALIKFSENSKVVNVFVKALLESDYFDRAVLDKVRGGTQKFISLGDIRRLNVCLPPLEVQKQFAAFVTQADKSKVAVQKALDEAQMLFDSLMQKYFG